MRFDSVELARTRHAPREALAPHVHESAYLSLVLAGEYTETVGASTVGCQPLDVRFHPPGELHSNTFGRTGAQVLNVVLSHSWDGELEALGLTGAQELASVHDGAWLGLEIWREYAGRAALSSVEVEERVALLLDRVVQARRRREARYGNAAVRRAVDFLHQHQTLRFSLFDVAQAAGLHVTHLARTFRRQMCCTVGGYARRLRALRALRVMRQHPDWTLSQVAAEAGFADHAHCTRTFATIVGTTPSSMRRVLRELQCACERHGQ
jgi:AraC family transcriptional regulator